MYAPLKTATDRLNPFVGMLGNNSVMVGNTGGDNRVEFGTRLDHSIRYESPKFGNLVSFDLPYALGQNVNRQQRDHPAGLAGLRRRQLPGQRQSASELRRRRLRRCVQRRPQVRNEEPLRHGGRRVAQGRQSQQRRHRLEQPRSTTSCSCSQQPAARLGDVRRLSWPSSRATPRVATPAYLTDIANEKDFKIRRPVQVPLRPDRRCALWKR